MINPLKFITRIKIENVKSSCCNSAGLESDSPEPDIEEEAKPQIKKESKNKKKDIKKDAKE